MGTARSHFGIDVIDARIKRAVLPDANQPAVCQRVTSNLDLKAAQIHAMGVRNRRELHHRDTTRLLGP